MFETIKNCLKNKEIRKKLLWVLLWLVVFRIGCYIPVPGLKTTEFSNAIEGNSFLGLLSSITGGSLANGTLFALGIGPYINASIIVQLLCFGIPALEALSKQGEEGRKKIAMITRYITIVLAVLQSIGIIVTFANNNDAINVVLFGSSVIGRTAAMWLAGIYMTVIYTAGSCLVMWIGDRITDQGVGNGISMVIFVGILSTAGQTIISKVYSSDAGVNSWISWNSTQGLYIKSWGAFGSLILFLVLAVLIFFAIVFVDLSERKIPVNYAKQVKGRKMYGGQSSTIPMKITGGGVMPLIFTFAIISIVPMITNMFWADSAFAEWLAKWFSGSSQYWYGRLIYSIVMCALIFGLSFLYAMMQFNPDDVSRTIQQNGGFIQGIRPGKPTCDYLKKINRRITLFGAIFLALVAFLPSLIFSFASSDLVNVFSTTGILIIVSVALEFDKQLEAQLMMKNYRGFLK